MSYCKHHVPVRICKTNYPLKKKELTRGIAVGDLDQSSNSKLRCNHRSNSSRIDSPDAFPRFHAKPTRFTTEAHRLSVSLSRKPKPFSAAVTIALRPFPSSKRRRFARKKSRISDLSLPSAVPLGAGCSWSLESSTLSLSLPLSLSLSVSLSWIANDEARIDKGPAALGRLTASEAATWNPTARDRKPIVSAALAGQSSEKPRPACLQRRSRKTGTSGCSHYVRLPAPPCTSVPLSRYRGNVFRPVRVHYRHAGRFTALLPSRD